MLQLSLDSNTAIYQISAYEPGRITVNQRDYTAPFIISPSLLIESWPVTSIASLTLADCQVFLQLTPKIILFGSGEHQQFPSGALLAALAQQGIGVESMITSSACRTYQILTAEGRNVVAGIFPG